MQSKESNIKTIDRRKVMVVHGRNHIAKESMFKFLRAIGLNPIEWSEAISLTDKSAPYIGEILEAAFSKAWAVVVFFTGDDEARLKTEWRSSNDHEFEKKYTPPSL